MKTKISGTGIGRLGVVGEDIYSELFRLPSVCLLVEVEEEDKHERVMQHHHTS